jgi:acetyl-CoA carboxylase biotin carboxylase subunit
MINDRLRKKMGKAARRATRAAKYVTVGTVEFLFDGKKDFYFLEMNTRIQVEHPVTEQVYNVDLVKLQIQIANGERLPFSQGDLVPRGAAIECRINAEDPANNFMPSPGRLDLFYPPGGCGVRVDSHAYSGYTIPPNYDSMIGKIITFGHNRREALDRMSRALDECIIKGIKTTIPLQQAVLRDPNFRRGQYNLDFLDRLLGIKKEQAGV